MHNYAAPSTATATVTARTPGCPDSVATEPVSVAACPPPTNGGTPGSGSPSVCDVLLWVSLILFLIGAILAIVGCVLFHWYPYAGLVVGIIGGVLLTLGTLGFIIWWIVCRFLTACAVILAVIDFVTAMIFIFGIITAVVGVIALIVQVPSMWGCVAQSAISWGGWGVILAMLVWLARSRRCLVPGPGTGSSSSPLTSAQSTRQSSAWLRQSSNTDATPMTGLGDAMKYAFAAVGVQPCGGCTERAQRLNERFPFGAGPSAAPPT